MRDYLLRDCSSISAGKQYLRKILPANAGNLTAVAFNFLQCIMHITDIPSEQKWNQRKIVCEIPVSAAFIPRNASFRRFFAATYRELSFFLPLMHFYGRKIFNQVSAREIYKATYIIHSSFVVQVAWRRPAIKWSFPVWITVKLRKKFKGVT